MSVCLQVRAQVAPPSDEASWARLRCTAFFNLSSPVDPVSHLCAPLIRPTPPRGARCTHHHCHRHLAISAAALS